MLHSSVCYTICKTKQADTQGHVPVTTRHRWVGSLYGSDQTFPGGNLPPIFVPNRYVRARARLGTRLGVPQADLHPTPHFARHFLHTFFAATCQGIPPTDTRRIITSSEDSHLMTHRIPGRRKVSKFLLPGLPCDSELMSL